MKKLSKIKLVNWHSFANATIPIEGNTLVSGENGSGKSTLLDALQYLLVGGRSGVKFNIAANDEAKRSLEAYIRGRIGAENKEYLRNGDCVTHIAMEFHDEASNVFSVIGVILELPKGGSLKERFYMFEDLSLHEQMFLDGKYPRDYRSMKAYMTSIGFELNTFDTQRLYRDAMARFFGLDARKYARILPKALAFRPIDLQNFVFEFLLDDDPVDIQSLKNNVEQLKRVETQIRIDREKLELLTKIRNAGHQLTDQTNQIKINHLIERLALTASREAYSSKQEREVENLENSLVDLRARRSDVDRIIQSLEDEMYSLERAKIADDNAQVLQQYQQNHANVNERLTFLQEEAKAVKELLENEVKIYSEIIKITNSPQLDAFVKYYVKNASNINPENIRSYLNGILSTIDGINEQLAIEKKANETAQNDLSGKMNILDNQLRRLRGDSKPYPNHVESLISNLSEKLSELYQKPVNVQPFCELIEVNDEHWRNAVEGYLGNQRFDIVIDPLYFNDALDIYEQIKTQYNIYGIGLVNTQKLSEYTNLAENSLASKLDSSHHYARLYANMLLGNVITVDKLEDLKLHRRSITASCMTYGNYTARAMNPRIYQVPYIGRKANDLLINKLMNEQKLLEKEIHSLYDIIEKNNRLARLAGSSKIVQIVHQDKLGVFDELVTTRRNLISLESKITELLDNPNIQEIETQINEIRQEIRNQRSLQNSLIEQISDVRNRQNTLRENIENIQDEIAELNNQTRTFNEENPALYNQASVQYQAYLKRFEFNFNKIIEAATKDSLSIESEQNKQRSQLISLMNSYINKYNFGAAADLDELKEFEKEYTVIRNHNLVEYEQEAIQLRRDSEIGFKEEFINKLRASIEDAQQQISELNIALDGKKFGKDSYRLITKPSDDPVFGSYYEIIMNTSSDMTDQKLFTENLSRKHEVILMELFDKIASSDPENDKIAYQLLDYRYYMTYDIEVTNENGNISYFSKVSREKSGGETQVPFYIVIAASFQQLLTRNKKADAGCIVLFDEAFNNMDDSRIDAMMKFYNSLSIQLLIAVPPQRVSNIIHYVNTSLAIVKNDDYALVSHFNQDGSQMR